MNLNGVWRLVEYLVELEDGRTIKPWGDDFLGYTLVSEEGFMSSSMIKTKVEINVAKEFFFSYSGPFELRDNKITVYVELCSEPSWVGGVQEREIMVEDDRFTAITPKMKWERTTGINKLKWKRI